MGSFWQLIQTMKKEEAEDDAPLLDGGEESKAMRVVRTGVGLRTKDCGNFWDDFISVCNDGEGLSELLDVPSEKIGSWASKVKDMLDKVDAADDQGTQGKSAKMVSTGTTPIGNPEDGVDAMPNEPADTRPLPS